MNMFENYYGKPQGNVNLYGFNFPIQWYNTIWFEGDTKHTQPLIQTCNGQEVVPKSNALDLIDKLYRVYTTLIISENLRLGIEDKLNKYEANQDKKNELILTNNDVIKNNQEIEKINNEREEVMFNKYEERFEKRLKKEREQMEKINNEKIESILDDMEILLELVENKEDKVYKIIKNRYCKGDE